MATAKRVGQDRKLLKVNNGVDYIKVSEVTEINGVVVHTHVSKSFYSPTVEEVYEDRPDRVVLEMSLEEAQQLHKQLGHCNGVHADTYELFKTLRDGLYSSASTQASPAKDASCATTPAGYKGEGSSTYR